MTVQDVMQELLGIFEGCGLRSEVSTKDRQTVGSDGVTQYKQVCVDLYQDDRVG